MPTTFMGEVGWRRLYQAHPPVDQTRDDDYLEFFVQPRTVEDSPWIRLEQQIARDKTAFGGNERIEGCEWYFPPVVSHPSTTSPSRSTAHSYTRSRWPWAQR